MKELYIVRGLPGSGKSTLAQSIVQTLTPSQYVILTTDDFFKIMPRPCWNPETRNVDHFPSIRLLRLDEAPQFRLSIGEYLFQSRLIRNAHKWNQKRCRQAMTDANISTILIDNTHVCKWEAKPYVQLAIDNGYSVNIVEPQTEWWINRDLAKMADRNVHQVALDKIQAMADKWEDDFTIENIMNCSLSNG